MHVTKIVTQLLSDVIHKTRVQALIPILTAIITSKQLRLTQLGRNLNTGAKERSDIRRVDRLLANTYYQLHSIDVYTAITQRVVANQGRPIILVDWTGLPNSNLTTEGGQHSAIRASLIAEGRSITLYEEVHPKKKENNDVVHRAFLKKLHSILPNGCCPYIVTDAGFKNPWFKAVLALGWDYIGRVRGKVNYNDGSGWQPIKNLFTKVVGGLPKLLGNILLAKENPLKTNLYTYKHKLQGRKRLTKTGMLDKHKDSLQHSRGYREPWLLVSSLSGFSAAKRVVKIYKFRMTIEGSFRDAKSTAFGFSLNENKTIKAERYTVWLLIASLAALVAWIIGYAAEAQGMQYDFQANTYRHRRVLSFFYLGCQIVKKKTPISIDFDEIQRTAWDELAWNTVC
jgi:hypothetical protein